MSTLTLTALLERYRVFLIDAYGVLVNSEGALPGARKWIGELNRRSLSYCILTNDASRLPERAVEFYRSCGLDIDVAHVVTAGMVIGRALDEEKAHRLATKPLGCLVLGTDDTREMVKRAGHAVLPITADAEPDAVVIGDDSGFDFLPTINAVLTVLHRAVLDNRSPRLLLINSDVLYPTGARSYGFTAGAVARLIENGLRLLHPTCLWTFDVIGKPSRKIFDLALERAGGKREYAVMLGDQLHTDIRGAKDSGLKAVLVGTGLTRLPLTFDPPLEMRPDHLLSSLDSW